VCLFVVLRGVCVWLCVSWRVYVIMTQIGYDMPCWGENVQVMNSKKKVHISGSVMSKPNRAHRYRHRRRHRRRHRHRHRRWHRQRQRQRQTDIRTQLQTQLQAQMISTDSETYATRSHSLSACKFTASSPRVLPQIDRRSRHRSPSLNLVRSFFLGWRMSNLITGLSRGEHPINRLGPKKLSRTVADLVYSRP